MLKQWLECGYIDKGLFYKTAEGTPQGGIISPTLMLLTLVGLEKLTKSITRKTGSRVNFIGYADDCVPRAQTTAKAVSMRNCAEDEGRPLEVALQEEASNHLKRLW